MARRAARADEDVLGVPGHADDLVRHDLADGKDEVVPPAGDEPVHLDGIIVINASLR